MTDYVGGSARELTPGEMAEIKRLTRELERAFAANHVDGIGLTDRECREIERMTAEVRRVMALDIRIPEPRIAMTTYRSAMGSYCPPSFYVDPGVGRGTVPVDYCDSVAWWPTTIESAGLWHRLNYGAFITIMFVLSMLSLLASAIIISK